MLGSVVAETTASKLNQIVHVGHIIKLKIGVLGVHVGKSAHLTGSALQAVVIVFDFSESGLVVEVFVSTHGCVEFGSGASVIN